MRAATRVQLILLSYAEEGGELAREPIIKYCIIPGTGDGDGLGIGMLDDVVVDDDVGQYPA